MRRGASRESGAARAGLVLALAALVGCSAGDRAGESKPVENGEGQEARHRRGLLAARPHAPERRAGGRGRQELRAGGRTLGLIYAPEVPPGQSTGLLLLLHGARGGAEGIIEPFEPAADRLRLVLFAPQSRGRTWDIIEDGAFGTDVALIDEALALIFDQRAIDAERVAVGGFSDGASYALSLGLGNGQLFRAILAFSPGFASPVGVAGRPLVFVSHGTFDSVLPIDRTSRRIVPLLRRAGLDVQFVEFAGDHVLPDEVLEAGLARIAPARPAH
ncbi:MAG TPA: hypothetical protein VNO33_05230 [Kofleriaceae bacterium]|nr:hypothetical protein [Kofleriaceae bacterium]